MSTGQEVLELKGISKSYKEKEVLKDLSLIVKKGEIVSIIGPNGSGKSTLLNIITKITSADSGQVHCADIPISYIFQNYRESLLPWRTNTDNLIFPLEETQLSKEEKYSRLSSVQNLFNLAIDWDDYPYNLSGGQQQLLAFMRALITKPQLLLIDEASSALDLENTFLLWEALKKYHKQEEPTILMITHDIEEAVQLSDTIVIFSKAPVGKVQKIIKRANTEHGEVKDAVLKAFQNTYKI